MDTNAIILSTPSFAETPCDPMALLLADKRSEATRRAYAADLNDFFRPLYHEAPTPERVHEALRLPADQIALRVAAYKSALLTRQLSEASVNRRLSAVRSLRKFAYRLGITVVNGKGLVDSERVRPYRDVRGVDISTMQRLLAAPKTNTLLGLRDAALLRLLLENALRRAEVCALNANDFVAAEARLWIRGKGRGTQKEAITLSAKCVEAIQNYVIAAGHLEEVAGPLFRNADRRPGLAGTRLSVDGLHHIIRRYAEQLGIRLTCHKLRHSGITAALDMTQGDVREVQKFSRHADARTLLLYDDARRDSQGRITKMLSAAL